MKRGIGSFIVFWYMVVVAILSGVLVLNNITKKKQLSIDEQVEITRKARQNK